MKIAMLTPSFRPCGPNNVVRTLISYLKPHQVGWFSLTCAEQYPAEYDAQVLHCSSKTSRMKTWLSSVDHFGGAMRRFSPDIIIAHGLRPTIVATGYGFPTMAVVHSEVPDDFSYQYGKLIGKPGWSIYRHHLKKFDAVVGVSENVTRVLRANKLSGITIMNPVDTTWWRPPTAEERARAKLSLGNLASPVFLVSGSLIRRKNPVQALDAAIMAADNRPATIIFAGAGPLAGELTRAARAAPPGVTVKLIGQQGNMREILWASDLLISMSRSEGAPLAVLEALSTGLPVLASNIAAHRNVREQLPRGAITLKAYGESSQDIIKAVKNLMSMPRVSWIVDSAYDARLVSRRYLEVIEETIQIARKVAV